MGLPCAVGHVVHCTRISIRGAAIHTRRTQTRTFVTKTSRLMVKEDLSKWHKSAVWMIHCERECGLYSQPDLAHSPSPPGRTHTESDHVPAHVHHPI